MNIWVIGNGESRKTFALNQLHDWTIGCNAIHRDYLCNEYVAVDRRMVQEILRNESTANISIYTRPEWYKEWGDVRVRSLPNLPFEGSAKVDKPFNWNSGPYAILLAANKSPTRIHLLGFDLWGNNDLVNNFYKGTPNYSNEKSKKINPDFWIYQLARIFEHYQNIEFVQHQINDWQIPERWKSIKNLTIKYDIV